MSVGEPFNVRKAIIAAIQNPQVEQPNPGSAMNQALMNGEKVQVSGLVEYTKTENINLPTEGKGGLLEPAILSTQIRLLTPPMYPDILSEDIPHELVAACTLPDPQKLPTPEEVEGIELQVLRTIKLADRQQTQQFNENELTEDTIIFRIDLSTNPPTAYRRRKTISAQLTKAHGKRDEKIAQFIEKGLTHTYEKIPLSEWEGFIQMLPQMQRSEHVATGVISSADNVDHGKYILTNRHFTLGFFDGNAPPPWKQGEVLHAWLRKIYEQRRPKGDDIKLNALFLNFARRLDAWQTAVAELYTGKNKSNIAQVFHEAHQMEQLLTEREYGADIAWLKHIFFQRQESRDVANLWEKFEDLQKSS